MTETFLFGMRPSFMSVSAFGVGHIVVAGVARECRAGRLRIRRSYLMDAESDTLTNLAVGAKAQ